MSQKNGLSGFLPENLLILVRPLKFFKGQNAPSFRIFKKKFIASKTPKSRKKNQYQENVI